MNIDDVIARLEARVSDLSNRVRGAAELSALVRAKALPNVTPFAYVLPLGLSGGEADAATGLFRQIVDDNVAVVFVVEAAGDATAERALPELQNLIDAIIAAMCGWAPDGAIGVLRLTRGALLSLNDGAVMYQLDFTIKTQLRISP